MTRADGNVRRDGGDAERIAVPPRLRGGWPLLGSGAVGMAMGVAEIVPGFSGGTVALVCGIYERLIGNIRQGAATLALVARGRMAAAARSLVAIDWAFVVALLVGMGVAILGAAATLGRLLEQRPVEMSATFLGLVLGAAVVAARQFRRPGPVHSAVGLAVAVVVFVALGAGPTSILEPSAPVLFLGAALAACAWILPGVSGAFLLLLLGLYPAALAAVSDRDLVLIGVIVAGVVTGLAAFSTLLHWLLVRHHDVVLAAMVGLLVGSTRVLWPWPSLQGMGDPSLGAPDPANALGSGVLAVTAFVLVVAVGILGRRIEARRREHSSARPDTDD